jgi:hypothetical protein
MIYPLPVSAFDWIITELHPPPAWIMETPCSSWAFTFKRGRMDKSTIKSNRNFMRRILFR